MKKILPALFLILSVLTGAKASAQAFITQNGDTSIANFNGASAIDVHNNIKSGSSSNVVITWKIVDSYFAPGMGSNGFCDNNLCQDSAHALNGSSYTASPYGSSYGDFHALFKDYGAANGSSSWVKVNVTEGPAGSIGGYSRTLVFIAKKSATGIATVSADNVAVFPNPARECINVLFDRQSGVKTIAIYNMIGKAMRIFKPSDDNSAKLDLDNIPSGVYFVRLLNNDGQVVATRRFTRQ